MNELNNELREMIMIFEENLLNTQKFIKKSYDKEVKSKTYTLGINFSLIAKILRQKAIACSKTNFLNRFI